MFRALVSSGLQVSLMQRQAQETAVLFVLHWVPDKAAGFAVPWDKSHDYYMTVEIYVALSVCTWQDSEGDISFLVLIWANSS